VWGRRLNLVLVPLDHLLTVKENSKGILYRQTAYAMHSPKLAFLYFIIHVENPSALQWLVLPSSILPYKVWTYQRADVAKGSCNLM